MGLAILVFPTMLILSSTQASTGLVDVGVVLEQVIALLWTVAVLSRRFVSTVVPWAVFQRRNRVVFLVGLSVGLLAALSFDLLAMYVPWFADANGLFWVLPTLVFAMFTGLAVGLGAAYVGGVRVVPLAAGGVVLMSMAICSGNPSTRMATLLLLAPSGAVLTGFVLQLRRYRERPPPEFWETRWYEWRIPLMVGTPGVAGVIAWILSGANVTATAWFAGIPAAFAVLNLTSGRISAFVARSRLGTRFPLHLD